MHNAALAGLAQADPRFGSWRYSAFDVEPERLAEALDLMRSRGFRGVNLTVPHKVIAVGLVGGVDRDGSDAGAVNTLLLEGPAWRGFNTDGYGLAAGIREDLGLSLRGASVLLLGAGGAARGAAAECLRAGCSALLVLNRTAASLAAMLAQIAPIAPDIERRAIAPGGRERLPAGTIVINATSSGLKPGDTPPASLADFPGAAAVYDMVYNPAQTLLLREAKSLGIPHANGLGMLVHQGAKALEIWTGVAAEKLAPPMRAAASKALGYG